jgi:hypothetical protein
MRMGPVLHDARNPGHHDATACTCMCHPHAGQWPAVCDCETVPVCARVSHCCWDATASSSRRQRGLRRPCVGRRCAACPGEERAACARQASSRLHIITQVRTPTMVLTPGRGRLTQVTERHSLYVSETFNVCGRCSSVATAARPCASACLLQQGACTSHHPPGATQELHHTHKSTSRHEAAAHQRCHDWQTVTSSSMNRNTAAVSRPGCPAVQAWWDFRRLAGQPMGAAGGTAVLKALTELRAQAL